jgi:hypothetical protein
VLQVPETGVKKVARSRVRVINYRCGKGTHAPLHGKGMHEATRETARAWGCWMPEAEKLEGWR